VVNSDSLATGNIRLAIQVSEDIAFGSYYTLANVSLAPLAAGESHPSVTMTTPTVFPSIRTRFYVRLAALEEVNGGFYTRDSIRMSDVATIGYEYGTVFNLSDTSPNPYLPQNPVFTLAADDRSFSLAIPAITSDSASQDFGNVTLKLYESDVTTMNRYFPQELYSETLSTPLLAGQTIADALIEGQLVRTIGSQRYIHLTMYDSLNNLVLWQTVYSNTELGFANRNIALHSVDYLTDSDSDGVADYSEQLAGTDSTDGQDVPGQSAVRVLLLRSDDLASAVYPDGTAFEAEASSQARITHISSYANTVLSGSGVDVQMEFIGPISVGDGSSMTAFTNSDYRTLTLDQKCASGAQGLLEAMTCRQYEFSDLEVLRSQYQADLVIYLDEYKSGSDLSCGVAWVSGVASNGDVMPDLTAPDPMSANYSSLRSYSVGVVDIDCSTRTLIHELGHLMGLGHSRRQGSAGTYAWSLGHGVDDEFVSIMAYQSFFGNALDRDYFSSALNLDCNGLACGVERQNLTAGADAVQSLNAVRFQLASVYEGFGPQISLLGDNPLVLEVGTTFVDPGAEAYDWEDGDLSSRIIRNGLVDTSVVQEDSISYQVTDNGGNLATVSRVVRVVDPDDIDGDGVANVDDAYPDIPLGGLQDTDNDGAPNDCDAACLGTGMQADADDDNDGFSDLDEIEAGTDPLSAADFPTNGLSPALIKAAIDSQSL
jgi:hypothetical protein